MISYLFLLSIIWSVGLAVYFVLLRRVPAHRFNRAFLGTVTLAGLLLPLLPKWSANTALLPAVPGFPEVWLPGITVTGEGANFVANAAYSLPTLLLFVGYTIAIFVFCISIYKLYRLHQESQIIQSYGPLQVRLCQQNIAPCSFSSSVYVSKWNELDANQREAICTHELAHYQLGHGYDSTLLHLLCTAFWFHPLAYVLRRELRLVHEFQADAASLQHIDVRSYRTTLFRQQFGSPAPSLAASFNQSPLNLRFMMMSIAFRQNQTWRLVCAVLCLALATAACTKEEIDESLLTDVAAQNTDAVNTAMSTTKQALFDKLVASGHAELRVDTITMFDPADNSETVTVVKNYYDAKTGEPLDLDNAIMNNGSETLEYVRNEKVLKVVDQMPRFPSTQCANTDDGCFQKEMLEFIYSNIKYPAAARDAGVEGMAVVSFVVGRDGELLNAKVVREVSPEISAEVLRIVELMPAWMPGMNDGKPVQVRFNLPVKFKLS